MAVPPKKHAPSHGPHARQVHISNGDEALVAYKLAHAPFVILVEDREADGTLLDILVAELGSPEMRTLWKRGREVTPRAIDTDTAGGIGSMPQRIERAVADAKAEGRPVRLFVFCDRDERWPGDTRGADDVQRVRDCCAKHDIPCHVLKKRCAENYIPDSVYEAVRNDPRNSGHVHRFNALLQRTPLQRDHFPVKDGMCDEERVGALAAGLYTPAEEPDMLLLKERLFPKRPRPLLLLNGERRAEFTGPALRSRDGSGEADALLDAIAREM